MCDNPLLLVDAVVSVWQAESRDLEARLAQIIKDVEQDKRKYSSEVPEERSPRKRHKKSFKTRQYDETGGEEAAMDDEELHSLLGV